MSLGHSKQRGPGTRKHWNLVRFSFYHRLLRSLTYKMGFSYAVRTYSAARVYFISTLLPNVVPWSDTKLPKSVPWDERIFSFLKPKYSCITTCEEATSARMRQRVPVNLSFSWSLTQRGTFYNLSISTSIMLCLYFLWLS